MAKADVRLTMSPTDHQTIQRLVEEAFQEAEAQVKENQIALNQKRITREEYEQSGQYMLMLERLRRELA